ncbi:hypothetical protein HJG60_011941 [Phyllostomus discolor]|uniref:Uncharacterized protein n=1 Tax=Phyllostomus discolor TaxID=89673 RepID=A0A833ZP27_9CHIR|nr:hypothetical protein HJG60_011941 [Phyllostomus discolor]
MVLLLTGETWFFLLTHVKNYISANLVVCNQFISGSLPWKRTGLGRVGGERQSFRAKQGEKNKRGWRPEWQAPGQPEAGWPEALWPESQEHPEPKRETDRQRQTDRDLCSQDLHSWWDRRVKSYILIYG